MNNDNSNKSINGNLIAHYKFDNPDHVGQDYSGNGNDGTASGTKLPSIQTVAGRSAVSLVGGEHGTSYISLPDDLLKEVSDQAGLTVSTWMHVSTGGSLWERLFDFGKGETGPYIF